jgi:cytoskeletal protein CcmA (bactofilin family)
VSKKLEKKMNSLPDDVTYVLGGLVMEGSLAGGEHPVVVDGQFNGNITANEIILREKGSITGEVKAKIVTISGHFNGDLICENLTVSQTGIVEGDVQANALSIDLGAEIMGSISRIR